MGMSGLPGRNLGGQADRPAGGSQSQGADRAVTDGGRGSGRGGFQTPSRSSPGQGAHHSAPPLPASPPGLSVLSLPTSHDNLTHPPSPLLPGAQPQQLVIRSTSHSAARYYQEPHPQGRSAQRAEVRLPRGSSCLYGGLPKGRSQGRGYRILGRAPSIYVQLGGGVNDH